MSPTKPGFRHPKRFRGDVNVALNRLVGEGVIASYRTNIHGQARPERLEVTVDPSAEDKPAETIEATVREALAPLHQDVAVVVANKPAISSKLADDLGGFA